MTVHDLVNFAVSNYHLLFIASQADDSGNSDTVKVALITTAGIVIAALFGFLGVTFTSNRQSGPAPLPVPDDDDESLAAELQRRAIAAEKLCTDKDAIINAQNDRIRALQDYLWERGINPYTFKAIGDSSA